MIYVDGPNDQRHKNQNKLERNESVAKLQNVDLFQFLLEKKATTSKNMFSWFSATPKIEISWYPVPKKLSKMEFSYLL